MEDADSFLDDLADGLYWHAKSLVATGDAAAALTPIQEAINVIFDFQRANPNDISDRLRNILCLRADTLWCLERTPGAYDALLESLLLEVSSPRQRQNRVACPRIEVSEGSDRESVYDSVSEGFFI